MDEIKWAIVTSRKLKIKDMVREAVACAILLLMLSQDITINSGKGRLRIDISGAPEDRFYQLKSIKRLLPSVVVKVCATLWLS